MKRATYKSLSVLTVLGLLMALLPAIIMAAPPAPQDEPKPATGPSDITKALRAGSSLSKFIDQPNPKDYARNMQRQRLLEAGKTAEANALGLSGNDRVLVILVEFAGSDTFTWTAGSSTWDPIGKADTNESTGTSGDCSKIITQTKAFTYGPTLHNQLPRPVSASDASGTSIWTTDFSPDWFKSFMFGNGVNINYNRTDGSSVSVDFTGKSVKQYFQDFSSGAYNISGDVIGWLQLPHSTWWYGTDQCPGARSITTQSGVSNSGAIPGAGSSKSLVKDALDAVNAANPGFDWSKYDLNGDGVIDRLWIVHSGYGEEDNTTLLNRTNYGEASMWSHSSSVSPQYQVAPGIKAGPYIMMPENGGIGVFAHESAHNLGAADLYAYGYGNTSTGFWALQADDWTGFPIGFQPPSPDPWHLDNWGWLNPLVVNDATKSYVAVVGQASNFPGGLGAYRGVKIPLANGAAPLPVPVWQGSYYWWGGKADEANGMMTTKNPIALGSGTAAALTFDLVYDIEDQWDFMWVQVSDNGGTTWKTITNTNTVCTHDSSWIGGAYGFPDDLCAAGIGGFTNYNSNWPNPQAQTFNLTPYLGKSILLRFWYMTDWATTYSGPFVDNVAVTVDSVPKFSDNAESGDANWNYVAPWQRSSGTMSFTQNYYLQWRNVSSTGGYDSALGDSRWRYGPANTGLLVWYNNNFYSDNEIYNYLQDWPSFGPKGRMLVVDSHPEPYRDPDLVVDYPNAISNLASRGQMRDAPFSLQDTVPFNYPLPNTTGSKINAYAGRPAVSLFNDGLTYYPGLEYARRGKLPCTYTYWLDKMWDASAVLPGKNFYSTKTSGGTGLTTGTGIRMRGFVNPAGTCQASWYGYWYVPFATAANTGNPVDSSADYGWQTQIQCQTNSQAVVRVWNKNTMTPVPTPTLITGLLDDGATSVSGTGAPNSPVQIIDQTTCTIIGTGTTDSAGRFTVTVVPLVGNHTIVAAVAGVISVPFLTPPEVPEASTLLLLLGGLPALWGYARLKTRKR